MWRQIFKITAIAGTLDIVAAFLQSYLTNNATPDIVLKYIASGISGTQAFTGGIEYIITGLLAHFFIVFACTLVYFLLYPQMKFLQINFLISSFLIAFVAWVVTTRLIIPNSKITQRAFDLMNALSAIAILYLCIGIPIAILTKRYYNSDKYLN